METADLRSRLVVLLREGSTIQQTYVAGLSAAEREAIGTPQRWSAKDLVAHLTGWKARRLRQLDASLCGEAVPTFDLDETNARTWNEQQLRSWEDILAEEARVVPELAARIDSMSVSELTAKARYPLPLQPAALQLARPGYTHVIGHSPSTTSSAARWSGPSRCAGLRLPRWMPSPSFPRWCPRRTTIWHAATR